MSDTAKRIAPAVAMILLGGLLSACTASADRGRAAAPRPDACRGKAALTRPACPGDELSAEEVRLIGMINRYRQEHGLAEVTASPSLALVANRHVRDLTDNVGTLTHGWSDCPYDPNRQATYPCMWEAPQRFGTPYPGNGYENAHMASDGATARSAFEGWKGSRFHNDVMLSRGNFQGIAWRAIGVAIHGQYAVLWFGEERDPRSK